MEGSRTPPATRIGLGDDAKATVPLVAGLGALTAIFAAAGVVNGIVGRMVGETPVWFGLALAFTVLAGFLTTVATLLITKNATVELVSLIVSNVLLLAGIGAGIVGAVKVWSDSRAPSVTASPERTHMGTFLNVTVKDSGLDSTEHVTLRVEPLDYGDGSGATPNDVLIPRGPIYTASLGSDDDGKVDHTARVRLPAGFSGHVGARAYLGSLPKHCYETADATEGCISEAVLTDAEPPQLGVRWSTGRRALIIRLRARGAGTNPMRMRAIARRRGKGGSWHELAAWSLPANANGDFDRRVKVSGLGNESRVCVVASTSRRLSCPAARRADPGSTAWVRYTVPRR